MNKFKRVPRHIGIIPDGNRRWAESRGLSREEGYEHGIPPAKSIYKEIWALGVEEVSVYIFTKENVKRPKKEVRAFKEAFIRFLDWIKDKDVSLLIVGDSRGTVFPEDQRSMTEPAENRKSKRKLNFLLNYNWKWDLSMALERGRDKKIGRSDLLSSIGSRYVSEIDLIIRWGSRRRLSGFLPAQSAYADIYVVNAHWPDYKPDHLYDALRWYEDQDITKGG